MYMISTYMRSLGLSAYFDNSRSDYNRHDNDYVSTHGRRDMSTYGRRDESHREGTNYRIEAIISNFDRDLDIVTETRRGRRTYSFPMCPKLDFFINNNFFLNSNRDWYDRRSMPGCSVTTNEIRTMDNFTYSAVPRNCWTLMSGDCSETPMYSVFYKKAEDNRLSARVYISGHNVELRPTDNRREVEVFVDGDRVTVEDRKQYIQMDGRTEVFK